MKPWGNLYDAIHHNIMTHFFGEIHTRKRLDGENIAHLRQRVDPHFHDVDFPDIVGSATVANVAAFGNCMIYL